MYRTVITSLLMMGALAIGHAADNTTPTQATTKPTTPLQQTPAIPLQQPTPTQFTPEQVTAIQKIIRDYLVSNPSVLVEASQALQQQTQQKQQQAAMKAIQQNVAAIFQNPTDPMAENPNGNVTLVEFFDYQCGHCKNVASVIEDLVKKDSNLRVIFKELPIFGGDSQYAAKAALASMKQGANKYYPFHSALLKATTPLSKDKVLAAAKSVGLNVEQLKKDIEDHAILQQIRDNFKLAQALQVAGTPTFVLGNKSFTQFKFIPGETSQQNLQDAISALQN